MSLSVTLVPGKVMQPQERIDNTKLNLLGAPSVEIDGAASEAQIGDKAVTLPKTELDPTNTLATDLRADGVLPVFDIVTARPTFNPRRYAGANDRAKIQAAIDAAIAEGGGVILIDRDYLLDDLTGGTQSSFNGFYHFLWAEAALGRAQLTFRGLYGARLYNTSSAGSGVPVALLGVKGAVADLVIEGLTFERQVLGADHALLGVTINEAGQGVLNRARVHGCHFRNLSNPIMGAANYGLRVEDCDFTSPCGNPSFAAAGGVLSYAVVATPTFGTVENVELIGNRMNGADTAHLTAGSLMPMHGFCLVQAMGSRIHANEIRRVSGIGINVASRPIGQSNPWTTAARELLVTENRIEFEDVAGQTANGARTGIFCGDAGATLGHNRIAAAYWGIGVSGLGAGFDLGSDAATRLRKLQVLGNDIELAADLKVADGVAWSAQKRCGIEVSTMSRVALQNNSVRFAGRTSAAAKFWMVPAMQLDTVDDVVVEGNEVAGPASTLAAATDLMMLTGLVMESCRKAEVRPNYFSNLNVGICGSKTDASGVAAGRGEIAEQRMEDVVWPWASMGIAENVGMVATSSLHKRLRGVGYKARRARTSFVCDAATLGGGFAGGYVRVGSFLNGIFGRVRVWCEDNPDQTVATVEVAYWNNGTAGDGNLVQVGFVSAGLAAFSKARVCVQNTPNDAVSGKVCHLDVYVPGLNAQRVVVEVEGPMHYEGLWGAPNLPASMQAGWTEANATGLKELVFNPGVVIADGKWNGGRMTFGTEQLWFEGTTPAFRFKSASPANETDGTNL